MTTGAVVATAPTEEGTAAALLRTGNTTLLGRLVDQLHRHGVDDIRVLTRPEWVAAISEALPLVAGATIFPVSTPADALDGLAAMLDGGSGPIVIMQGEILTQDAVIAGLLLDPRVPSGIVSVARNPNSTPALRVRIDRGRVSAAESPFHAVIRPNQAFLQTLKIAPAERANAATVAREIADLCRETLPPLWEAELRTKLQNWGQQFFRRNAAQAALANHLDREAGRAKWMPDVQALRERLDSNFRSNVLHPGTVASEDVVSLLLTGLCRSGMILTSSYLRELFWSRPFSQQRADTATAAMATVDEDKVLLDSAVKGSDGFFTTFFVSPYSRYIARWCARRGLTPNQVTSFSMFLGAASAGAFATGSRAGLIAGALLLQAAFTTDCVDGQLARYTRRFSKLGAWLDSVFDRSKEYLVFAGLAFGAVRMGDDGFVWLLAAAALTLQTVRHAIDFSWAQSQHQQIDKVVKWPMNDPGERAAAGKTSERVDSGLLPEDEGGVAEVAEDSPPERKLPGSLSLVGRAGVSASRYFEKRKWMKWVKRIIVLPIGERFALISLTAAIGGARVTFTALLIWGGFALLYSLTGRVLRSAA